MLRNRFPLTLRQQPGYRRSDADARPHRRVRDQRANLNNVQEYLMKAQINNRAIGYVSQGQGLPVVLVHGFPLSKAMWESQVQALSSGSRVIAIDLRGHGESQVVEGPGSMDAFADDINGLLGHLGIDQAVIAGFSMGGYVAFAFYRKYPGKVKALVLADTRPQADTPEAAEGRRNTAKTVLESPE